MDLLGNDRSWLSIEFRYGIPGIVSTRNRSGIGRNSGNQKELPVIPRNFGITSYRGLLRYDPSWLSIEFRYGIPGITSRRNQFLQFRNSQEFLPIPRNSYQFPSIASRCNSRNSVAELLSAFTLTINYVYGYRLTSEINEQFRYGIPGITSRRNQCLQFRNSQEFRF